MNEHEKVPVLEIKDLNVSFQMYKNGINKHNLEVIHSLSIDIMPGEILALIGSSGSGKSILAHTILGILPKNTTVTGSIRYQGQELTKKEIKNIRGREIVLIPQSVEYLDPLMRIDKQVMGTRGTKAGQEASFRKYNLDKSVEKMYPFQLSGGMARRVLISTATMESTSLIIADEPTPGLNLELAIDTMEYFRKLADNGSGILLITHDIDLALHVANRVAVLYAGTTVEVAPVEDFIKGGNALRHPYSKALMDALPQNGFAAIAGTQPYAENHSEGCQFAEYCQESTDACRYEVKMRRVRNGEVRCGKAT